jgi:hypothetical protein
MVREGMGIEINRVRFSLEEDNVKSSRNIIPLKGKIICTKHPKFYTVKIQSNYENSSYIETFHKKEFHMKLNNQLITIL